MPRTIVSLYESEKTEWDGEVIDGIPLTKWLENHADHLVQANPAIASKERSCIARPATKDVDPCPTQFVLERPRISLKYKAYKKLKQIPRAYVFLIPYPPWEFIRIAIGSLTDETICFAPPSFWTAPEVQEPAPQTAKAGDTVILKGGNVEPGETVNIDFSTTTGIASAVADDLGNFAATFVIPTTETAGKKSLKVTGATSGQKFEGEYRVTA